MYKSGVSLRDTILVANTNFNAINQYEHNSTLTKRIAVCE